MSSRYGNRNPMAAALDPEPNKSRIDCNMIIFIATKQQKIHDIKKKI
jgi:hypothetical protein